MTATDTIDTGAAMPRFLRQDVARARTPAALPLTKLILTVLLPFATGYFLSYVFRQINIVIAGPLRAEFDLSAAQLGLMTSMYFLAFAVVLLPLGAALDRYGPRSVQSLLMLVTAAGAAIFAWAESFYMLIVGRAVIGVGVAVALMAGLKAVVLWVRPERMALASGSLVMFGSLGAVAATMPAEALLVSLGWRGVFEVLAVLCVLCALLIYVVVPEQDAVEATRHAAMPNIIAIYADRRFWRIAPMAATVVAASWSLQGLWAAPWLADVEGLSRADVVRELFIMAVALSAGGLLLGAGADRLKRRGLSPVVLLAIVALVSIAAQAAIVLRLPIPPVLPWAVVAIVGASTVLGYAGVTELFPKRSSGRATAALNILQIAGAFVVQCAIGFIVALWPGQDGHPPATAYQAAFAALIAIQLVAFLWYLLPLRRSKPSVFEAFSIPVRSLSGAMCPGAAASYERATQMWITEIVAARQQAWAWRKTAIGCAVLALALTMTFAHTLSNRSSAVAHIVTIYEVRR